MAVAVAAAALFAVAACTGGPARVPARSQGNPHPHPELARKAQPTEPLLEHVRQLSFAGRRSGEGYFGPASRPASRPGSGAGSRSGSWTPAVGGERLIFQSEREPGNPFYQIYLMDLASGRVERVSPGVGKTTCGWIHPDGQRVLFASTHLDPEAVAKQEAELALRATGKQRRYSWDFDPNYDLFTRETNAEEDQPPRRFTSEWGYDAEASWSPDGRMIVWASNRHAYSSTLSAEDQQRLDSDPAYFMEIYLIDLADLSDPSDGTSGTPRRLTYTPGYDGGPFFSPDGESIVWRRFSEDGAKAEIYTQRLSNAGAKPQIRQLTRLDAMSWAPFYHPSGDYVVFSTNLHGFANFELYAVDAKGHKEPVRVTYRDGFDGLPAFAPGGAQISWTSGRTGSGDSQIFLADWNDAEVRRLLGLPSKRVPQVKALLPVPSLVTAINAQDLRAHVEALSSEAAEGRLTGSAGARIATGYVARVFRSLGLAPAGDDDGYFQHFDFVAGVSLGENGFLRVTRAAGSAQEMTKSFEVDRDWRPLAFSRDGVAGGQPSSPLSVDAASAEVVFAGYGIVSPASDHTPELDAYAGLDVTDKWVLLFRYIPEGLSPEARQHLHRYSSLRYKAMLARDKGARGVLIVSGPRSKVRHQLVRLAFDTASGSSSLTAISISNAVARGMLRGTGRDLGALQDEFDRAQGDAKGFALADVRVAARVDLRRKHQSGRNVLARLRANTSVEGGSGPAVVIGAHIDHLGRGEGHGSLARSDETGAVHRGADDNASGVAALLEIAQDLATRQARGEIRLRRDLIFAAWSGEEIGLLGSSHFADAWSDPGDPHSPLSAQVAAYINMDMVGRLRDGLLLYGIGSSTAWPQLIERHNAPLAVPVITKADSFLPSDSTPFAARRVPTLSAFTGVHSEYHTPRDTPETLNFEGLVGVSQLIAGLGGALAERPNPPDYVPQEHPRRGGPTTGFRAYLGTIPDYAASDVDGLRLSGVVAGGPAERAGLRSRDVVVELAGRKIENIYDYTFALEALEIGVEVDVSVLRGGDRLTLQLLPASRE